jgi:hypothetical protein
MTLPVGRPGADGDSAMVIRPRELMKTELMKTTPSNEQEATFTSVLSD